jgi:hypothetical protein
MAQLGGISVRMKLTRLTKSSLPLQALRTGQTKYPKIGAPII